MIDLIGFAHTPFTRAPGADIEALMARAATEAIADAGLEASDIDAVVIGHFGHGLIAQGFVAGLSSGLAPGLRGKPSLRVESACASGSAAVHQAALRIAAGQAKRVLVIGAEVMSSLPTREVGQALLKASYVKHEAQIEGGFAGMFARIATANAACDNCNPPRPSTRRSSASARRSSSICSSAKARVAAGNFLSWARSSGPSGGGFQLRPVSMPRARAASEP